MINFILTVTITISEYQRIQESGLTKFDLGSNSVTQIATLGEDAQIGIIDGQGQFLLSKDDSGLT